MFGLFIIGVEMLTGQIKIDVNLTENPIDTIHFACNEFNINSQSYNSLIILTPFIIDSSNYLKLELLDPKLPDNGQFDLIRKINDTVYLRPGELFSKAYYKVFGETIFYSFSDSLYQKRTIQTTVFNNTYVTLTSKYYNYLLNDTLLLLKLRSSIDFTSIPFVYELLVSNKYGIVYYGLYNNMQCSCRRIFYNSEIDPYFLESISKLD